VLPGQVLATLTFADVQRLKRHTRRKAETFAEVAWLNEQEAADYTASWPLYDGYFRMGPARWTLRQDQGACVFHRKGSGCQLPADVRPVACRLYPFEPRLHGGVGLQRSATQGACLAVEEAGQVARVLKAFQFQEEDVLALCQQLRTEVEDHARALASGNVLS